MDSIVNRRWFFLFVVQWEHQHCCFNIIFMYTDVDAKQYLLYLNEAHVG